MDIDELILRLQSLRAKSPDAKMMVIGVYVNEYADNHEQPCTIDDVILDPGVRRQDAVAIKFSRY